MTNKSVPIVLKDGTGAAISFEAGFKDGRFFETAPNGSLEYPTATATVGDIVLTGDQWRDVESGDYLERFLKDAVFGSSDPEAFLATASVM